MKRQSRSASRRSVTPSSEVTSMLDTWWSWDKMSSTSSSMKNREEETWESWSNRQLFKNWHLCFKLTKNHLSPRGEKSISSCLSGCKEVERPPLAVKWPTTTRRKDGEWAWSVQIPSELVLSISWSKMLLKSGFLSMEVTSRLTLWQLLRREWPNSRRKEWRSLLLILLGDTSKRPSFSMRWSRWRKLLVLITVSLLWTALLDSSAMLRLRPSGRL